VLALYRRMHPEMKPAELLIEITTDSNFWVRSVMLAERKPAKGKAPVYMYSFNWRTPVLDGKLMAPHAIDVRFHAVIGMKIMFGHQQLQGVKRRLDGSADAVMPEDCCAA
jgi:carboxylesterase type B